MNTFKLDAAKINAPGPTPLFRITPDAGRGTVLPSGVDPRRSTVAHVGVDGTRSTLSRA